MLDVKSGIKRSKCEGNKRKCAMGFGWAKLYKLLGVGHNEVGMNPWYDREFLRARVEMVECLNEFNRETANGTFGLLQRERE